MGWQESLQWPRLLLFMGLVFILITFSQPYARHALQGFKSPPAPVDKESESWCPLPTALTTVSDGFASSLAFLDDKIRTQQVERLSAAVNVATVSYPDSGDVDQDPRYKPFEVLQGVLQEQFPLVHERMRLEKVNKYGLLYTLDGHSTNLKPVLFTAHQDIVPAPDPSKWTHPPFSAHYDGQWLWGRGSVDCKNHLIGLLSTMESLLDQDFKPKRTIMLSFGFDEETGGKNGAKYLATHIEQKLGKNSIAMLVDEGGGGIDSIDDVTYAFPAVAEKGFVDIILTLDTPGGHSSKPPIHSAIGIMSDLVLAVENHPFTPSLDDSNPYRGVLACQARYSPDHYESWLTDMIKVKNNTALTNEVISSRGESARWLMQTSQAVDVISGGTQDNQLPGRVQTTINYRVAAHDNIDRLLKSVADVLAPVAHSHGIALDGFGYADVLSKDGLLNLTAEQRLAPSPISPTGPSVDVWNIFASTIVQVFTNTTSPNSAQQARVVVPAATLMTGNTDTQHYWGLTRNIYRFSPTRAGTALGVHTADERLDMRSHVEGMMLYYELIRNLDAFTGE